MLYLHILYIILENASIILIGCNEFRHNKASFKDNFFIRLWLNV